MTKNVKIGRLIIEAISNGMTPAEAIDAVCGEGTYKALASDVHDARNGK